MSASGGGRSGCERRLTVDLFEAAAAVDAAAAVVDFVVGCLDL